MADIDAGRFRYVAVRDGQEARVHVADRADGRRYLRTNADQQRVDNLDLLPELSGSWDQVDTGRLTRRNVAHVSRDERIRLRDAIR